MFPIRTTAYHLPAIQPTSLELVNQTQAAKALDVPVPPTLLTRAGSFATRTAMPWRWASSSLKPTRASGGSVNMQYGTSRSRLVRVPPLRLAEMIRKSSNETWVNCGLPAASPIAKTSGALVSSRSLTAIYPRSSSTTPATSSPIPAVLGVRPAATRRSLPSMGLIACRRAHLETDGLSGPALHTENLDPEMHRDAFVAEHFEDRGRNIGIFPPGELRSCLHDAYAAAEASIGLCQLQANISATKHDQMVGQSIELERLDIGERRGRRETRNIRDRRMRPEIEGHAIAGQNAGTAVIQCNLDGFRRDEAARTHDQLGAAGLVAVEVHGDQAVDHLALSCQHSLHVGGGGTRHDPKAIGVVNEIGNFRAPNLVLAGQAVGVRARTADQLAFDDGGAVP